MTPSLPRRLTSLLWKCAGCGHMWRQMLKPGVCPECDEWRVFRYYGEAKRA